MEAATAPTGAAPAPAWDGLKRAISRNMLLLFVVGDVLGAGIYALVGDDRRPRRRRDLGVVPARDRARVLHRGGLRRARDEVPARPPGAALYVNKAFGVPFVTFMVAFAVMCSGLGSASTLARAFGGDYLAEFISVPTVLVAFASS
jgi:hypothetical protein